jgi:predicted lipoprotein with Yx(FWY)xxD motif
MKQAGSTGRRRGTMVVAGGLGIGTLALVPGSIMALGAQSGATTTPVVMVTHSQRYGAIVVNAKGRTLYHLTVEDHGEVRCTGECTAVWPPVLVAKGTKLTGGKGLEERLGTVERPGGKVQLTYGGWPLYTYVGDAGSGQTNGEGIPEYGGKWLVTSTTASTSAGSSHTGTASRTSSRSTRGSSSTSSPHSSGSSGGYGY